MKLSIENWLGRNKLPEEIVDIFNDAVLCYKNGIYRAALMLTYTGFFKILKERLMNSSGPSIFPANDWATIQREIIDDDVWEKKVFDLTQQGEKRNGAGSVTHQSVFSIKQGIRDQLKYWKDRRNDCAHHKRNTVGHYHVESFWAFIESNISKITIEGGKDSLLNKIRDHYNISLTPSGADITPLVMEIENCVDVDDLVNFWNPCFHIVDRHYSMMPMESIFLFIEKVFEVSGDVVKDSMVTFLKTEHPSLLMQFLEKYPQRINELKLSTTQIRQFWHDQLINSQQRLTVFAAMLNTQMIPIGEKNEAIERIITSFSSGEIGYQIKPELNYVLTEHGFTGKFEERYLNKNEFKFYTTTNNRSRCLGGFLYVNEFNQNTVELLCHEYSRTDYQSNFLFSHLERIFTEKPERKVVFKQIADDSGIVIPQKITDIIS